MLEAEQQTAVGTKISLASVAFLTIRETAAQKFNRTVTKATTDAAIEKASAFSEVDDARLTEVTGILSAGSTAAADMNNLVSWVDTLAVECATAETGLGDRFEAPSGCEIHLQKSPPRLQDARQTDVQIGWFDDAGAIRARILIESKVTADFQPGQVDAYVAELTAARANLGPRRAATVLVAPAARIATLLDAAAFDASISIEEMAEKLDRRRGADMPAELDARLAMRVQLLEALCGKRASSGWIAMTVPEKRDFAEAYAALALEQLPTLHVRPSTDGPKAITRIFEGLTLSGLPTPALRHEFGNGVPWKWVNAQFAGFASQVDRLVASGILTGTTFSAEAAGKSLAIRASTPGVDPQAPFDSQRDAVLAGLQAMGALVEWLATHRERLAEIIVHNPTTPADGAAPVPIKRDPKALEGEFSAALRDIYAQCDALGYRPTGMLQMMERLGGINTGRRLLNLPPSEGFGRLALMGRLDLTVETLILEPRWSDVFTDDERRTARRRLR